MLPSFRKPEPDLNLGQTAPVPTTASPSTLGTRPAGGLIRGGERGTISVIGPELIISGNLISKGEVQIEGEVQGDIHGTHIMVGEGAQITGGIIADEVVVRGHVMGSIRGKRVLLQTSSHVEGDVYHNTLAIEQGAFFEGKSRRTDNPTAGFGQFDKQPGAASAPAPQAAKAAVPAPAPAPAPFAFGSTVPAIEPVQG
jgi:cytoskeletal protein CcmA (bactofilin family)